MAQNLTPRSPYNYNNQYSSVGTPKSPSRTSAPKLPPDNPYSRDSFGHVLPEVAEKKEVVGWYLYDWANGAFFYSAMNYLPLMITAQAREMAIYQFCGECPENEWAKDFENEGLCSDRKYETNSTCVDAGKEWTAELDDSAKYVDIAGVAIGYASFTQFCLTVSVILQLIIYVTMGSFADYGRNRKSMFIFFNTLGTIALIISFFIKHNDLYYVNGILFIVAVVAFSFSVVFYNAYLPLLAAAQPAVIEAKRRGATKEELLIMEKNHTHTISLNGLAAGFSGQLLFLVGSLGILGTVTTDEYLSSRISILATAAWMIVFTTICFYRLKTRPGPPLPPGERYCHHSVHTAWKTLKSFKKLKELGKFLIAYFVFSDGTSTLATSAAVFAQEELKLNILMVGIALVEVSICAVLGCFFFKWLHEKKGVSSKKILMFNLFCMGLIPIWGLLFLENTWEFYAGIVLFGFNTGSQQAFTRSIYAHHLPYGREAEYFSFYEISDKGTAWLGPLVVALVFQATGSYRDAFSTLIVFFVLGIFVLYFFDADTAELQKKQFDEADGERISTVHMLGDPLVNSPSKIIA